MGTIASRRASFRVSDFGVIDVRLQRCLTLDVGGLRTTSAARLSIGTKPLPFAGSAGYL